MNILISLDDELGTMLELGVRTTKVNALDGNMLTVSNGNFADMTIHTIGKREFIRRVCSVTVTSDTPAEKIDEALIILR